jgi:hypothetical protein
MAEGSSKTEKEKEPPQSEEAGTGTWSRVVSPLGFETQYASNIDKFTYLLQAENQKQSGAPRSYGTTGRTSSAKPE